MNVFQYIAESNPSGAMNVLARHGYKATNIRKASDLGICLNKLVNVEGEDAFRDVMAQHPDKGVLVELFAPQSPAPAMKNADAVFSNMDGGGRPSYWDLKANDHYMNFNASQITSSGNLMNVAIIASALLITAAIITKK